MPIMSPLTLDVAPVSATQVVGRWSPSDAASIASRLADSSDSTDVYNSFFLKASDQYITVEMAAPSFTSVPSKTAAISSVSRSGTTATVTTSAAHGMTAGATITVSCSDGEYGGRYSITSVTSDTITYTLYAASGSTGAATGEVYQYGEQVYAVSGIDRIKDVLGLGEPSVVGRIMVGRAAGGTYAWEPAHTWTGIDYGTTSEDRQSALYTRAPSGALWQAEDLSRLAVRVVEAANSTTDALGAFEYSHTKVAARLHFDADPRITFLAPVGTITDTSYPQISVLYDYGGLAYGYDRFLLTVFKEPAGGWGTFDRATAGHVVQYEAGNAPTSASILNITCPVALEDGESYRFYLKVRKSSTWAWSPEVYTEQTVALTVAQPAAFSPQWHDASQSVRFSVTGMANLLTANTASMESDTSGWEGVAGSPTLTLESGRLRIVSATALGDTVKVASRISGTNYTAVAASTFYAATASVQWEGLDEDVTLGIQWLTSGKSVISETTATAAATTSGTTTVTVSGQSPANAAYARVTVAFVQTTVALPFGPRNYLRVDDVSLSPCPSGGTPAWSFGGVSDPVALTVEASDDGGATWRDVRVVSDGTGYTGTLSDAAVEAGMSGVVVDPLTQTVNVIDYEARRGQVMRYRAVCRTLVGGDVAASVPVEGSVTTGDDGAWWLKCPHDPSINAGALRVKRGFGTEVVESQGVFEPLDGSSHIVVSSGFQSLTGSFTVVAVDDAGWAALEPLLLSAEPLLMQGPLGIHVPIRLTSRSVQTDGLVDVPVRVADCSWVQVER